MLVPPVLAGLVLAFMDLVHSSADARLAMVGRARSSRPRRPEVSDLEPVRLRLTFDDFVRSYPEESSAHIPRHEAARILGIIGFFGLSIDGAYPRRARILAGDDCDCR